MRCLAVPVSQRSFEDTPGVIGVPIGHFDLVEHEFTFVVELHPKPGPAFEILERNPLGTKLVIEPDGPLDLVPHPIDNECAARVHSLARVVLHEPIRALQDRRLASNQVQIYLVCPALALHSTMNVVVSVAVLD